METKTSPGPKNLRKTPQMLPKTSKMLLALPAPSSRRRAIDRRRLSGSLRTPLLCLPPLPRLRFITMMVSWTKERKRGRKPWWSWRIADRPAIPSSQSTSRITFLWLTSKRTRKMKNKRRLTRNWLSSKHEGRKSKHQTRHSWRHTGQPTLSPKCRPDHPTKQRAKRGSTDKQARTAPSTTGQPPNRR